MVLNEISPIVVLTFLIEINATGLLTPPSTTNLLEHLLEQILRVFSQ